MTICNNLNKLKGTNLTDEQRNLLKTIEIQAGKMEDRLLVYCNAIENLGFIREGRDYKKQ